MSRTTISYKRRKIVFQRDKHTCVYCKRKAETIIEQTGRSGAPIITLLISDDWKPFEIDHKIPISKGGSNEIKNLLTCCARCNNLKATMSYYEFKKRKLWLKIG